MLAYYSSMILNCFNHLYHSQNYVSIIRMSTESRNNMWQQSTCTLQFIEFSLEFACTSPQAYYCRVQPNISVHIHFVLYWVWNRAQCSYRCYHDRTWSYCRGDMEPCVEIRNITIGQGMLQTRLHGLWTGPWTGLDSWRPFTWPINWLMHRR